MAWTDPDNQSFITTGWKMFLLGAVLIFVNFVISSMSKSLVVKSVASMFEILGALFMIGAVIVWIAKASETVKNINRRGR